MAQEILRKQTEKYGRTHHGHVGKILGRVERGGSYIVIIYGHIITLGRYIETQNHTHDDIHACQVQ